MFILWFQFKLPTRDQAAIAAPFQHSVEFTVNSLQFGLLLSPPSLFPCGFIRDSGRALSKPRDTVNVIKSEDTGGAIEPAISAAVTESFMPEPA